MSEVTAQHLLGIYRARLSMAERGVTHPEPEVVAGVRKLVAGLAAMPPDARVTLDAQPGKYIFKSTLTGDLIAEIDFDEIAEPFTGANAG